MGFKIMETSEWKVLFLLTLLSIPVYTLVVNHDSSGLTTFPTLPSGVITLKISWNQISNIPPGSLTGQTVLTSLYMIENLLTSFPDLCDVGASLEGIYFEENMISTPDETLLCCLTSIKVMRLSNNQMSSFPNISCLGSSLEIFDLSRNPIVQVIDSVLAPLVRLTVLDLGSSDMNDTMIKMMKAPPNVEELILNSNAMTELPDWGVCHNITRLTMRKNQIEKIPEKSLQNFPNIYSLDLEANPLIKLPGNKSFSFPSLQKLYINKATSLQNLTCDFLEIMPGLTRLEVVAARLKTWNCEMNQPHFNLETILMENNDITHLPRNMSMLKALRLFLFSDNPTEKYPDFGRDVGNTLTTFRFSGHGNIPDHALSGYFPALVNLQIRDNDALTKFPKLGEMPLLERLTITQTSIRHICVPYLPKLTIFNLNYNKIISVPDIRFNLPKWASVKLEGNANLVCDCDMQWMQGNIQLIGGNDICKGTPDLEMVSFLDIDFNSFNCPPTNHSGSFRGYGTKIPFKEDFAQFYKPMVLKKVTRNKIECAALCQQDQYCQGWKTTDISQDSKSCQMYMNNCVADETQTGQNIPFGVSTKSYKRLE